MAAIEIGCIDRIVKQLGLVLVFALHLCQASFFLQPLANQIQNINAPGIWRVVKRFVGHVRAIVKHGRQPITAAWQQVFANDDDGHAARAHILLRACVD